MDTKDEIFGQVFEWRWTKNQEAYLRDRWEATCRRMRCRESCTHHPGNSKSTASYWSRQNVNKTPTVSSSGVANDYQITVWFRDR